ncbi:MAG: DUF1501 domain-containing protein [Deltaproteobacteria bacterium]|nr:DUF1501 domain-containing protein [Deltaproteobacteria bacterium]
MKKLNRRDFLKNLTACACGTAIAKGLVPFNSVAFAQATCATSRKSLVTIFLNGGPHGPSILVPRATQSYFDKHPTLGITNSLPIDTYHGLHPSLANIYNLYTQGKAVFLNGAGYPNHSRSHEDSTNLMGNGIVSGVGDGSGWGGRFAKTYCGPNEVFSLFSFRGNISDIQAAGITAPTASSLGTYGYSNDSQGTNNNRFLRQVMAETRLNSGVTNPHQQAMLSAWDTTDNSISTIAAVNSGYTNGVAYPNTGLAQRMRDAAKLIVSNQITAKAIFISHGGFDTHGSQNNSLPNLLTTLDQAVSAFWQDMVNRGRADDVMVLFYGEFGRTHENDNQGTDHGTGTFMGLIGNNVRAGVASPAYQESDFLQRAPWVPVKFDYREVIEQIHSRHMGVDPAPIFPEAFNRVGLNLFA